MRIVPAIYGLFEGRVATPLGRRLSRPVEAVAEWRAWMRTRPRRRLANARLKDRFCTKPFDHFELTESGSVYLCCPTWLRKRAGNLHEHSAEAVWNSAAAQDIRRGILDGSFRHCNHQLCPLIQAGTLPTRAEASRDPRLRDIIAGNKMVVENIPRFINFSHDKSCNLSCPSCRTRRIQFNEGPGYEVRKALQDRLTQAFLTRPTDQPFKLSITGSGDPFASRVFREFLFALDGSRFPNMRVNLQTNGILFTEKSWNKLRKIHGKIEGVLVSFDAATASTYSITRRGGDWDQLLENMELLARLRRDREIRMLALYFVVQHANFREMPAMVALGKRFSADHVDFSKAVWWGTWTMAEMRLQRVWEPDHPDHPEFARVITDPILEDPIVSFGNLAEERTRILACPPSSASTLSPTHQ
jgi:MoaA/NifB/PqqE/SkfB family radical SAM enzyme